ncbi:MAG TPA: OsmC family protein [Solirubrobacterales bacterium]
MPAEPEVKRAVATRREGYTHDVTIRGHTVVADEPESNGGNDAGPTPTEYLAIALASCTAITVQMYADRKGWDIGDLEVVCEFTPGPRGECDDFDVTLKLPGGLTEDQTQRIHRIAGKCPVHRTLAAEAKVTITDRVEVAE